MRQAFIKYYLDVTRYSLVFSIIAGFITASLNAGIITFSTIGMIVGLLCYRKFQKNQYFFYYNQGITKSKLIITTWSINAFFSSIFILLILKCAD